MSISTILIAVLVFGILIFIHELGHFLAAKFSGVGVLEFALGMGPALFQFRRNETTYSLRLFPIGGYCAFEGEEGEVTHRSSNNGRAAFYEVGIVRRMIIMLAGAAMNLLLGFVLLGILTTQQPLLGSTVVAGFHENAVSNQQLQAGDVLLKVNNHRVKTDNDLIYEFTRDRDGIMNILVEREGSKVLLENVAFEMHPLQDGTQTIFLDFRVLGVEKTPMKVIQNAFNWTGSIIKQVWGSFIDLITGRYTINQLSGPVGVTDAIGKASSMGWRSLMLLVSFITVNLGVFNLLPLPALDGGKMIFLIIEAIRRKPINPKYEGLVHTIGFMLLVGLMIFVTFNDVQNLF